MRIGPRQAARIMVGHLLLPGIVFLPVFLSVAGLELTMRAGPSNESIKYQADDWFVLYLVMILPIILGSVVHGALLWFVEVRWPRRWRWSASVALAPLVPLTVILSNLPGGFILLHYPAPAAIATLAYGLTYAVVGERSRAKG
jgi:hypothetical protein